MSRLNQKDRSNKNHPAEMLEEVVEKLPDKENTKSTAIVAEIKEKISQLLQKSETAITAKNTKETVHFVQKSLRQLGFYLNRKTGGIEKMRQDTPSTQFLFGIGKSLYQDKAISESTLKVLEMADKKAQSEKKKINFVVFDTPQATNLSSFAENQLNYDEAYKFAEKRGGYVADSLGQVLQEKGLKNIEITRFGEIERQEIYQKLENVLQGIIENDKNLLNQLLNTVSESQLHKAGIGREQKAGSSHQSGTRRKLANYALKAITLHIYSLGDTIVHSKEKKNYRLTQTILRNKKYRDKILSVFNCFDNDVKEAHLCSLCEAGFLYEESFGVAY